MHVHAAIDVKADASEIVASFAAEKGDGQANIAHFAKAKRDGGRQFGDAFFAMRFEEQFRLDNAWRDGVDGDAVWGGCTGQCFRETQDAAFRRSIMDMTEQRALMGDH